MMLAWLFLVLMAAPQAAYDLVILNGRVMDPETGRDAVLNVGIRDGRVERITSEPINGARRIDASGMVVAPGFIDLHSHGQDAENYRLKALDGVTAALELEIGVPDVEQYLRERQGRSLIHFGATVSHPFARGSVFGARLPEGALVPPSGPATDQPADPSQLEKMKQMLAAGVKEGALGIGMGLAYTPGATRHEVIEMFRLAASLSVPVFIHVRSSGKLEPGSSIEAVAEAIAAAAISGAPLHIVHINSTGLRQAAECLRLIEGARARGLDITTEGYPYGVAMTSVNSAFFNPGWQDRLGISYPQIRLVETGERLTPETFERYHAMAEPQLVLLDLNPEEIVDTVITHPLVMVASDGHIEKGKGHPRGSGTFARILGRYVRERKQLTLMDALRKMSYLPARRLESASSEARRKGRLQEGADADIVVFDPERVIDQATYEAPDRPSLGIRHLLVNGTPVVEEGRLLSNAAPGRALRRAP